MFDEVDVARRMHQLQQPPVDLRCQLLDQLHRRSPHPPQGRAEPGRSLGMAPAGIVLLENRVGNGQHSHRQPGYPGTAAETPNPPGGARHAEPQEQDTVDDALCLKNAEAPQVAKNRCFAPGPAPATTQPVGAGSAAADRPLESAVRSMKP